MINYIMNLKIEHCVKKKKKEFCFVPASHILLILMLDNKLMMSYN